MFLYVYEYALIDHFQSLSSIPSLEYKQYTEDTMINRTTGWFPCPVCVRPLDVRTTKKKKPYVVCSMCGVQVFVRERAGIEMFERLVEQGLKADILTRIGQLEQRYKLTCPDCAKPFWANVEWVETNRLSGKVSGYRCPERNCQGVVPIGERLATPTDPSPKTSK